MATPFFGPQETQSIPHLHFLAKLGQCAGYQRREGGKRARRKRGGRRDAGRAHVSVAFLFFLPLEGKVAGMQPTGTMGATMLCFHS
jgi:hypothetical protein